MLRAPAVSEDIPGIALAALLDERAKDGSMADCPLFRLLDRQTGGESFSLPVLRLSRDGHAAPDGSVQVAGGMRPLRPEVSPMRDTIFPRWQGAFLALFLLADGLYLPASPETVRTLALGCVLGTLLAFLWLSMLSALRERDFESLCLHRLRVGRCAFSSRLSRLPVSSVPCSR